LLAGCGRVDDVQLFPECNAAVVVFDGVDGARQGMIKLFDKAS
jgi:hypothetical protein